MSSPLEYRRAVPADRDALIQLGLTSYGQYAPWLTSENLDKLKGNIANTATWDGILENAAGFVCCSGNNIVGMGFLVPSGNPWDMFEADWSYIRMVGVHPQWQGHGIARQLMVQAIAHARSTGETTIALHTSERMEAARSLYHSLGFSILRPIPDRLGWKYWLYTLDLKT